MPLICDNETGGISFIWTLQNYKHCDEDEDSIASPSFVLKTKTTGESTWDLVLMRTDKNCFNCPKYVSLWLRLKSTSNASKRTVPFALSVLSEKGDFMKKRDSSCDFFNPGEYHGHLLLRMDGILEMDLTVRCRIWRIDGEILPNSRCYARTMFGVERTTYRWSMGGSARTYSIFGYSPSIRAEEHLISINIQCSDHPKYPIEIKRLASKRRSLCVCKMSWLVEGDEKPQIAIFEHRFEKSESESMWIPEFDPMTKVIGGKKTSFECEVVASNGDKYNMVERVEFGELENIVCAKEQQAGSKMHK